MKIKLSETTKPQLNWLVARCQDLHTGIEGFWSNAVLEQEENPFDYITDWALAGPIIEREYITHGPYHGADGKPTGVFQAYIGWDVKMLEPLFQCDGPTPLIAAMRCYVASKLGEEVEVPDELL